MKLQFEIVINCLRPSVGVGSQVTLISSKSRVYLLKDRDPVGLSDTWSAGVLFRTFLIGRTGFDTIPSIPNQTLSLKCHA